MTEAQLQALVLELARWLKLLAYHTHDSRRSARGFPDLVICGRRGHLFAELKSEHGECSPEQDWWGWMLTEGGARYHLWRPADWHSGAIERELRELV